ncbi:MAG: protein-glutamate O-methyltransferase CheR [Oscillospiraceae bacterium]|nr:protein-glutamate O-methyltransferase CheR [Oscillospiraceae bacterium]
MRDDEFKYLVSMVKSKYGINLQEKRVLLEGRLTNYITEKGFSEYMPYIKLLESDTTGREVTNFLNRVTTNHTYFMRESEHFDFFRDKALPSLEPRIRDRDFRIWCAASSTGEEPYTLAMILHDYFGGKKPPWDKRLLATDLSQKVLDQAIAGKYPAQSIEKIPERWKKKYFTKAGADVVQVVESIRREITYRKFNLMDKIIAKKPFHVIFCRNVMIYFDMPTKTDLVDRMYDVMAPGGYIFLGQTETIAKPSRFNYVMPSVYQKGG